MQVSSRNTVTGAGYFLCWASLRNDARGKIEGYGGEGLRRSSTLKMSADPCIPPCPFECGVTELTSVQSQARWLHSAVPAQWTVGRYRASHGLCCVPWWQWSVAVLSHHRQRSNLHSRGAGLDSRLIKIFRTRIHCHKPNQLLWTFSH
jgi:hypothetical protein